MRRQLLWRHLLFAAELLEAQSTSSTVTGKITDPSGSIVPAAQISIANEGTGLRHVTTSNDAGSYVLPLLPPGRYRITVQKEGLKPMTRTGIELKVNQVARIDFVLELGAVSEVVEVTGSAPLIEQETSALGQVVDNRKILSLPLNGRMTFRLVNLTPAVLMTPGSMGQFGDISVGTFDDVNFSINGGRAQSNEVMVDGVPSTTGFLNLFTTIPSVEATQEFKVQSNSMSAEWGRFGGGVINVSTRGGTNQLHGSLFEFLRNSAFDANEFFNKRAGREKPPFRMNQFGGAAGGPVHLGRLYDGRNKTFFFANFEGTRWRRGDIFPGTVPTERQRSGDFSQTFTPARELIVIYDPLLPFQATSSRKTGSMGRRFLNGGGIAAQLARGWNLSTILTARTGTPLALRAPFPGGGNRPNSTGLSAKLSADRSRQEKLDRWFDTAQFLLPPPFSMGNVARTLPDVRGPGVVSFDFSLVKEAAFKESLRLQIRAEAFNALNRPQFWTPNTALGSLDFGRITASQQTLLPRVMQFALKLVF